MSLSKPYKRTVRLLTNGTYTNDGHWQYLIHPDYASEPQHYVRAFLIIQEELLQLFEYIEPCDQNLETVSLKIQGLLIRVCIEIEANFTAILKENQYSEKGNWRLDKDYKLIEYTHQLSAYKVKLPLWKGEHTVVTPFKNWSNKSDTNWHVLEWYQAYNKSKHDRHNHFDKATLRNLLHATAGLVSLLSSQFMSESYSPRAKGLSIGGGYSYGYDPAFSTSIGGYFKVKYPDNWDDNEQYGFNWQEICDQPNPIDILDYDRVKAINKTE